MTTTVNKAQLPDHASYADVPFPVPIDWKLGEHLQDHESDSTTRIANELQTNISNRDKQSGCFRRDVHSKSTGILKAKFSVDQNIPPQFAKGVFVPGKSYEAIVRLSNAAGDPTLPDDNLDHRGIAIKLLGVEGPKILESDKDATTQDFLLISRPFFPTNDAHAYAEMTTKLNSWNPLVRAAAPLCLGARGVINGLKMRDKIANPLQIQYFSAVPFALGKNDDRQAVKYSMKPVQSDHDEIPPHPGHDYLEEAVAKTLSKKEVKYRFMIQPRVGDSMDIEDSMSAWSEEISPFQEVATVTFPRQDIEDKELIQLGEKLSFNPWHSLEEHKPLGSLNRVRKVVYERISRVRNQMNDLTREEPKA
ncbi:hypothetical protein BGZ73_006190 [Actinomortierella ambigua]|nr:hypothetical protein BGZ73_006190 [Actinomortierella ambigua]